MALTKTKVKPAVTAWAAAAPPAWTAAESDSIATAVVALSKQVTPRVTADVALPVARADRYLLARTVGYLERWLVSAASTLRRAYGMESVRLRADGSGPALGLRAASSAELIALPGVDDELAARIAAFAAQSPDFDGVAALGAIDGIGPGRVLELEGLAYRDEPRAALLSPALLEFLLSPGVPEFLRLLERTDLELDFGDGSTLLGHARAPGATRAERFLRFLAIALEEATRSCSVASARLNSEASRWLDRHQKRQDLLDALRPATGAVLVDEAYLEPVKALVDGAATEVKLMVFLATATAGTATAAGSLPLIEALEAAAARGVQTRVILDQDEDGVPYRSAIINRPVVNRLKAAGATVKLDEKDTLLHSKLLVVDGTAAVVGSHNWTRSSMSGTHELSVLLQGAEIASAFEARFDAVWNRLPAA